MEGRHHHESLRGLADILQYIFIIYGAVTVLIGALVFFALPNSPSTAWFFTEEEKKLSMIRLAENQTGVNQHKVRLFSSSRVDHH